MDLWWDINKSQDITLLNYSNNKKHDLIVLEKAWEKINDELLQFVGLTDEVRYRMEQKKLSALAKINFILTGKTHFLTHAEIHELNAVDNSNGKTEIDLDENMAKLTKYFGTRIRAKEITVKEYYSYVKEAQNGSKKSLE